MTTTSDSIPSRWPRFLPKQFSIGAMLVLITVVACFLWWYVQPPEGIITRVQASQVTINMTDDQVQSLLGEPLGFNFGHGLTTLTYGIDSPKDETELLLVSIAEGRVIGFKRVRSSELQSYPPQD